MNEGDGNNYHTLYTHTVTFLAKNIIVLCYFVKVPWSHSLLRDGTLCRLLEKEHMESMFCSSYWFIVLDIVEAVTHQIELITWVDGCVMWYFAMWFLRTYKRSELKLYMQRACDIKSMPIYFLFEEFVSKSWKIKNVINMIIWFAWCWHSLWYLQ